MAPQRPFQRPRHCWKNFQKTLKKILFERRKSWGKPLQGSCTFWRTVEKRLRKLWRKILGQFKKWTKSVAWLRNVLFNVRFTVEKIFRKLWKKFFSNSKKLKKASASLLHILKDCWKMFGKSLKKKFFKMEKIVGTRQYGKNCWNQAIWKKKGDPGNMKKIERTPGNFGSPHFFHIKYERTLPFSHICPFLATVLG